MESEVLNVRRITLKGDEVKAAIEGYIKKHHNPAISFDNKKDFTVTHKMTPAGKYLSASIEIIQDA